MKGNTYAYRLDCTRSIALRVGREYALEFGSAISCTNTYIHT